MTSTPIDAAIQALRAADLPERFKSATDDELRQIALVIANALAQKPEDGKIIDPVTGLVLPPDPGRPYRERGYHPDATRLTIFEHLQNEYAPYLDAHLLFSGHLQDIDKPAYDALLYMARKSARIQQLPDDGSHTPVFFLEHGVLAGEHMESPPDHLRRQVDLINQSRALNIVPKVRGRRPTPAKESRDM